MAVTRPEDETQVTFELDGTTYSTVAKRGQIIHEPFHHALPPELTVGHRLTFAALNGDEFFADNLVGDVEDTYGEVRLITQAMAIAESKGEWKTIGFDHLAITLADRADARDFFRDVVGMQVMCDDPHLTVMATGPTALFLFDAGQDDAPLTTSQASQIHHIGFIVDNLKHAYTHLQEHKDRLESDFTLLDRDERWSLYFFYRNGDVRFMIQFSEVKQAARSFTTPEKKAFADYLYDYTSRPYGLRFDASDTTDA
ncbi:MAG TPA: VOC family protein [Thermomicrobiales bacterium]|nr:VOC family protein [Thermomicrobiales bacterium]